MRISCNWKCILLLKEETSRTGLKYLLVGDSFHKYRFIWFYIKTDGLKASQEDPLDCFQVPEIYISLMEEERMDPFLFYDLTLTTSCGMANIIPCLMFVFN